MKEQRALRYDTARKWLIFWTLFIGIGAVFVFWRLVDVFLVLFGGLSPRGSGKPRRR